MARLFALPRLFAVLASTLLALCAGNAFAQAAYVHDLTGTATATAGTAQRTLKIGDLVDSGSTISTGEKSTAVVKFEDGQVMALAEKSSFRIVDYRYNKERVGQSSAVFNLLQGGLRFISGVIGSTNRSNFRMTAGTATIGIRGTDGTAQYDSVSQAVLVAVLAGALTMDTSQGAALIAAGNFSSFTPGQAPTVPQPTTQATAAVQAAVNGLAVRNVPINTPVVVQASAAAAAAVANAVLLETQAKAQPNNAALQAAAAAATKLAQDSLATAIGAAQQAFDTAVKAGAIPAAPPAPPPLPQGITGSTAAPSITVEGVTISPTPAGSAGSGGSGLGGAGGGAGGGGGATVTPTGVASPN